MINDNFLIVKLFAHLIKNGRAMGMCCKKGMCVRRSLSALSAYHSGVLTPMKMRTESQSTLRLYSGSPTRTDKDQVSISSFYYKERVRLTVIFLIR